MVLEATFINHYSQAAIDLIESHPDAGTGHKSTEYYSNNNNKIPVKDYTLTLCSTQCKPGIIGSRLPQQPKCGKLENPRVDYDAFGPHSPPTGQYRKPAGT